METLETIPFETLPENTPDTQEIPLVNVVPETVPEKPKRQRKKKDDVIVPDGEVIPRRRGSKKETVTNQTPEMIAKQLFGLHQLASVMTGIDLSIQEEGAQDLGKAIYEVIKQYDLDFIGKYSPWFNLIITAAVVELPVFAKLKISLDARAKLKKAKNVTPKVSKGIEPGEPLKEDMATAGGVFANIDNSMPALDINPGRVN